MILKSYSTMKLKQNPEKKGRELRKREKERDLAEADKRSLGSTGLEEGPLMF